MTKSRGVRKVYAKWSDADVQLLRELYPNQKSEDVAAAIGKTTAQVYSKAGLLGLKKSPDYLAGPHACRLRQGDNVGAAFRFQPGITPWNKGKAFVAGGRSVETRFVAGHSPGNTKAIGSYRITKDGTLQRKVSNDPGNNSQRWRGVHELVWVEVHGPVPPKHIVVFKPGQRTAQLEEITIDRVECISLAENMKRNTRHNLPKELSDLIQLRGALNRVINNRTSNEQ